MRKRRVSRGAPAPKVQAPREVTFPLQPATVKALLELDAQVKVAQTNLAIAEQRMFDRLGSILTEHGIEQGVVTHIDDAPPHGMTILVSKFAPKSGREG